MDRNLNQAAHNVINGANIFNRFELVIETLQKTAFKKQCYLKSSLFHLLISSNDRKWCSCATSNKLFFFFFFNQEIKNEEIFFSLSEVCEPAVYSTFWGWEVSWDKSKLVTCYVVFPLCPWLSKSTASNQEYLYSSAEAISTYSLRKRSSTLAEVSAVAGEIEGFLFSPRGCVSHVYQ